MSYFRFTIRQLLLATIFVAFACATILHPSRTLFWIWTALSWIGFVSLIATSIVRNDVYRKLCLGALIFCTPHVASFSFETFSDEFHPAARRAVMGFAVAQSYDLWSVPSRSTLKRIVGTLDFDHVDPEEVFERDAYLLGILRWDWIWVVAGIGAALGTFVAKASEQSPEKPIGPRWRWLYDVAITAVWVVCSQFVYYELTPDPIRPVDPHDMWSTYIPSLTLLVCQVLMVLAVVGTDATRKRYVVVAAASGLWLAMAFLPGWSATLGDFLPQAMWARALSPGTDYGIEINLSGREFSTSPAIVQGEVYPAGPIEVFELPDPLVDPPPRLGITSYLVGGVVGGYGPSTIENSYVSIAACMMVWPIVLATRWLWRWDSQRPRSDRFRLHGLAFFGGLLVAVNFRQAWFVQLLVLAVYIDLVLFVAHALVGALPARREYAIAALAMLGWLLISCGPWFGDHVRPYLPTTLAFNWIDKQLGCEPGQPGPDMTLSAETERSLRSSGTWGNRAVNAWPTIVASLGLDHRYPLSTPGTILMAFPAAWIGAYLSRRWSHSPSRAEQPTAS